jgi:hypothetical protein
VILFTEIFTLLVLISPYRIEQFFLKISKKIKSKLADALAYVPMLFVGWDGHGPPPLPPTSQAAGGHPAQWRGRGSRKGWICSSDTDYRIEYVFSFKPLSSTHDRQVI